MGDAPVMGDAPAPPGPPPKVMGGVPSPPSAQGQVVGSEGSAEEDGEAEDCNGEKVVVKEKERPPPAVPPADRPAGPTVAVPPAGPPADPPAAPSVGDRNLSETPRGVRLWGAFWTLYGLLKRSHGMWSYILILP